MLQWRFLFALVLIAAGRGSPLARPALPAGPATNASSAAGRDDVEYRLDQKVIPSHYEIELTPVYPNVPGLSTITEFGGDVTILAKVVEQTKIIFIHRGDNVKLEDVKVFEGHDVVTTTLEDETTTTEMTQTSTVSTTTSDPDGGNGGGGGKNTNTKNENKQDRAKRAAIQATQKEFTVTDFSKYDEDSQIAQIELSENIRKDTDIKIVISYSAKLVENALDGMYLVKYKGKENADVGLLATQFESTFARKAFPCFDEPGLKASFDLSIHVKGGIEAIANTPGRREDSKITFETTPKMTTYNLAFVIYEKDHFDSNPKPDAADVIKSWARAEAVEDTTTLSNKDAKQMLNFLSTYTKIDYFNDMEMKKLDQAAIPEFYTGAQENWGLVTYRETAMLTKEGGSTAAHKRISEVIAHELAHQWFGNWVTTEWWSSTWLNEGFANYFQYLVMHDSYDQWQMLERMVLDEQMVAFDADSSATSRPMTDPQVNSPSSIAAHFGTISYSKGGSILRQIRNIMGNDEFQDAVQDYVAKMEHGAAEPQDLFDSLVQQNKKENSGIDDVDFVKVLKEWTTEAGYPVVRVSRGEEDNKIEVTQKRFIQNPVEGDPKIVYRVPLTWYTDKATAAPTQPELPQNWLTTEKGTVDVDEGYEWVILNAYQAGYYRVNYDRAMWQKFSDVLWGRASSANLNKVAAIDRAALINNALSLARSGDDEINYPLAVMLIKFLRYDAAFLPWAAARSSLAHVERMLSTSPEYKNYIKFLVEEQYEDKFADTGATGDDGNIVMTHRVNFLSLACAADYAECIDDAEEKLSDYLGDKTNETLAVPINLQPIVYCYGLKKDSGAELWEKLWEEYETEATQKDATRRGLLITALGCVEDTNTLQRYLGYSLETATVNRHERHTVFSSVYSNPKGVEEALKFLENKYDTIKTRYGRWMSSVIAGLASRLTTPGQSERFAQVLEEDKVTYAAAIATAEANVEWMKTHGDVLKRGMRAASKSAPAMAAASLLTLLCAALLRLFR